YNAQWQQTSVSDADAGNYSSEYNALGELLYSIDPRNHRYDFTYDALGRIKTRSLAGGGDATEWFYDPAGNLGALDKVHHNGQDAETYSYDALGRVQSSTQYTYGPQNKTFTFGYSYDNLSRLSQISYPGTYKVDYAYDNYGYLSTVTDNKGSFSWSNPVYNDLGQLRGYNLGNGLSANYTYDAHFRLDKMNTTLGGTNVFNWDYDFNTKGNLTFRHDIANGPNETFNFDNMNRLTNSTAGPNVAYGSNTNISAKSDIGTYQYNHAVSAHKLTGIDASSTSYRVPDHQVDFNSFNKVSNISTTQGSDALDATFTYSYNRSRSVMQVLKNNVVDYTKYYAGKLYEEKVDGSGTTKYHYVYVQGRMMGLYIDNHTVTDEKYYVHTDYLGSVTGLTDQNGSIVEEYAYDAWGRRRNPYYWQHSDTRTSHIIDRGYTGHE
ncbi:MAG: hypothetical protein MI892_14795, partial [Desulfobacterales bacterium]|nr:hypothetical protein [Desulfobacterales bacterium]